MDAQRSAIEAREAPFNSADEPSPDNFFEKGMKHAHKNMLPAPDRCAGAGGDGIVDFSLILRLGPAPEELNTLLLPTSS